MEARIIRSIKINGDILIQTKSKKHCAECDIKRCWSLTNLKCFVGINITWKDISENPKFYYLKERF